MSIDTKHIYIPRLVHRHVSSPASLHEILADFKSLEDLAVIETESKDDEDDLPRNNYKTYLQIHDYRRPKAQENYTVTKFRKLNRSYSMQELKEKGVQMQPLKRGYSQPKCSGHALILSEFIL